MVKSAGGALFRSATVGKAYLIFEVGDSIATMRAYRCTLTTGLENADETIKLLEETGYRPRQPQLR